MRHVVAVFLAVILLAEPSGAISKIEGRVYDDGAPMSGVLVEAIDAGACTTAQASVSDDAGRFIMEVPPGSYDVEAWVESFSFEPVSLTITESETRTLTLQAEPDVVVYGRVVRSGTLAPVEGMQVVLSGAKGSYQSLVTDSDGKFVSGLIANDVYDATVEISSDARHTSIPVAAGRIGMATFREEPQPVADIVIPGGSISGVVISTATGMPVADVKVDAVGPEAVQVVTDGSGAYLLDLLPGGIYSISFYPQNPELAYERFHEVELLDDQAVTSNMALSAAGIIAGTVRTVSGDPVEAARISASSGTHPVSTYTGASGAYLLGNAAPGTYRVSASRDGMANADLTDVVVIAGTTTPNIDFSLPAPGGTVAGFVYEADGVTPISGAQVFAGKDDGTCSNVGETDTTGAFDVGNLQPGTYTVGAFVIGGQSTEITGVYVQNGQTTSGVNLIVQSE